jgi:peptide/nickel transport system permease protein
MLRLVARRLLHTIPTALGAVTLVFLLVHLVPGDPIDVMLGESARGADKESLRRALGLDRPLLEQYRVFLTDLSGGNLGRSLVTGEPVATLLWTRVPATVELTAAAMLTAVLIALPLGLIAAARPGTWLDRSAVTFALFGVSMPSFWLGPLMIMLFAIELGWVPVSGRGTWPHLVLPALTLGSAMAAVLTRMTRASLLECIGEEYVRAARAKGVARGSLLARHALANALPPVVTILGLQFGALLAGTVITETIFAWPGIGRLTIDAINQRDYPVVQGCVLVIALSFIAANTLADLANAWLDPRVRTAANVPP